MKTWAKWALGLTLVAGASVGGYYAYKAYKKKKGTKTEPKKIEEKKAVKPRN